MFDRRPDGIGIRVPGPDHSLRRPATGLPALFILLLAVALPVSSPAQVCDGTRLSHSAGQSTPATEARPVPVHRYEVVARYPHDTDAFTQGLVFYRGELYESTGIRGRSAVRRIELESGRVLQTTRLGKNLFGEGLTVQGRQLVQLTWTSGQAFLYNPGDLRQVGSFRFGGEGWGSTSVDGRLVISDGSSWLRFIDSRDFRQVASIQVTAQGHPVIGLNELEAVNGLIYANIYPGDCIAQIEPHTGRVVGWIDLSGLYPQAQRPHRSAVANGIAYLAGSDRLFVTGKLWPYLYEVKIPHPGAVSDKQAAALPAQQDTTTTMKDGG